MKVIASVTTLCTLMAFSGIANANESAMFDSPRYHQKGGAHRGNMMKRMIKVLSLSEQQQAQIKAIKSQAKEQDKNFHASMRQFRQEVKALVHAETFDEHAFTALQGSYQASFAQAGLAKAKTKHAIFNILTTEQQQKWLAKMEKGKEKIKEKRNRN